jgi:hypothetical protein
MLHIAIANLQVAAWGVSVKPGLDGYCWDVRKSWDSNGKTDNMIVRRESGRDPIRRRGEPLIPGFSPDPRAGRAN